MKPADLFLSLALLLVAGGVWAATSGPYGLPWSTVDGGGTSTGGVYTLSGTAGQPDAGVLSGGEYTLGGGFWRGGAVATAAYRVYLPVVMRGW
jgi:hypothetical protein